MSFIAKCTELLKSQKYWGYHSDGPYASEPTALVSLAANAIGQQEMAQAAADWLVETQASEGSVGVTRDLKMPAWTTSLACMAWLASDQNSSRAIYKENIERGREWLLSVRGKTIPKNPQIGHDPTIVGWSWAADTHSWMEPTCLAVLALKSMGYSDHPRTREGVKMINDRLLAEGGCNFGSTDILGQATLPQIQATGFALLALADENIEDLRIAKSLDYLETAIVEPTSTASLCYGIMGLTAHGHRPALSNERLKSALNREIQAGPNAYKLALLLLANQSTLDWLPKQPRTELVAR